MIAKVCSRATKASSEVFKCSQQDPGATHGADRRTRGPVPQVALKRDPTRTLLLQGGGQGGAEVGWRFDGADACGGHRCVLVFCSALAAADDRAGVAHAASRRSSLSGDEADHGLLYVGFDPFRSALFGVAADLADHNDGVGVRIVVEKLDGVEERGADDGIAANADAGGLANAELRQLMDGFVGERAAAANDADISLLVDAAGHDADFAFARGDDAGAVRADQARFLEVHDGGYAHHVEGGDAFGDADDEGNFGVVGFQDGIGGVGRRNKNDGGVCDSGVRGVSDGVEDGALELFRSTFARRDPADDACAIFDHLLGVESSFAAGEALDDEASFFVDQDAHRAPPARATTFWAPSFMPSAMVKFKPLSRRIFWPASTLVPSMRMTTGTCRCNSLAAETTPVARTSQRKMPPKILTNTALTSGSLIRMRKAFFTCSAEAPPPTSRKFAGEPPAYLMMSMVAMARPAPFTMQATLPSSLM